MPLLPRLDGFLHSRPTTDDRGPTHQQTGSGTVENSLVDKVIHSLPCDDTNSSPCPSSFPRPPKSPVSWTVCGGGGGRGHGSGRKTGLAFTQSDDLDKQDMSCHAKETAKKKLRNTKRRKNKASQVLKEKPLKVVIITQDKARRLGEAAILIRLHWLVEKCGQNSHQSPVSSHQAVGQANNHGRVQGKMDYQRFICSSALGIFVCVLVSFN